MGDGQIYSGPHQLSGLENRVCVFNTDFIERNLQWGVGRANSIFYISQEQADVAVELHAAQQSAPLGITAKLAQDKVIATSEKALKSYRTQRAKVISGALHLGNRRYEAGQLQADYEKLLYGPQSVLAIDALEALIDVARLSEPPPSLSKIEIDIEALQSLMNDARNFGDVSIGQLVLEEFDKHPSMVSWIKAGYDYHTTHDLDTCLFCGNGLTKGRGQKLAAALDDKIAKLLTELEVVVTQATHLNTLSSGLPGGWPKAAQVDLSLQDGYASALKNFAESFEIAQTHLKEAGRIVAARLDQPTMTVVHALPSKAAIAEICGDLDEKMAVVNALIEKHNTVTADFSKRQQVAREAIRKHFIAEESDDYANLKKMYDDALDEGQKIEDRNAALRQKIADLSAKVKSHGPAAEQITKLVRAYLGHGELTIVAVDEGYELHRHGKLVRGQPSEGEKTAIALCYFLSTLKAEGRSIKDLIVMVDDPISSLDTKAMTYACVLLRSWLAEALQVFVLTHNQHCMNEFKKAWRSLSKAEPAKAIYLFLDVTMPITTGRRTAKIIEMPAQLKGYDSDYHFLCHKVLQFEAAGEAHSEYWFMMPNVIRRVLEIFLAFKIPGSHSISQKLDTLIKKYPELDKTRVVALERLIQVESHSDSLDNLIARSSITIEEARVANAALLDLMKASDEGHEAAIRAQCKAA